jgi:hypothetical protein
MASMQFSILVLLGIALPVVGGLGGIAIGFLVAARRGGWKQAVPQSVIFSAVLGMLLGLALPAALSFSGVLR